MIDVVVFFVSPATTSADVLTTPVLRQAIPEIAAKAHRHRRW